MSAYVSEEATINRIATWVEDHERTWRKELEAIGIDTMEEGWGNTLRAVLIQLYVEAVNYRYEESADPKETVNTYPMYQRMASDVEVYKSMQGWQYQCSEGEYHKYPLFKLISEMMAYLAYEIIAKLPAYDKAAWA